MGRSKFRCLKCGVDTGKIGEYYMLKDEIWFIVHNSKVGMLCIGCVEKILGRSLTKSDFNDSHVNKPYPGKLQSTLLTNRLKTLP